MAEQKKSKSLTTRQQKILNFIKKHRTLQGNSPTIREIGAHFGISVKGSYDHLKAIIRKGYIKMESNKARSIKIIKDAEYLGEWNIQKMDCLRIPVAGMVKAGALTYADEDIEEYLTLPLNEYQDGEYFALRIKGDSMIECGIYEDDIVILRRQTYADDGDIVAARVEDEATLKRLLRKDNKIYLMPENRNYQPIIVDKVAILGKVIAVYRTY